MGDIPNPLAYLVLSWAVVTSLLVVLIVYRATLSSREDDQLYLSKVEDEMMASEQRLIIDKMNRLGRPIFMLTILSGALLLLSAGAWILNELKSF